jgi:hypothetical protein
MGQLKMVVRVLFLLTLEQLGHLYHRTLEKGYQVLGMSNEGVEKRAVGDLFDGEESH